MSQNLSAAKDLLRKCKGVPSPRSRLRIWAVAAIALWPRIAAACPVCFGSPNTPSAHGMNNAIVFLLGMVGFVQIGFVALFFSFWRRARALRRRREQLQLIDGGVR